jgi:hypothetical protein
VRNGLPEDEEARLKMLFAPAASPVADEGFTEAVLARLSPRRWTRPLVLAPAALLGALLAAGPATRVVAALSRQVTQVTLQWPALGGGHVTLVVAAAAAFVVVTGALRWLEE